VSIGPDHIRGPDPEGDPDAVAAGGPGQPRLSAVVAAVAVGGVVGAEARYGLASALPHAPGEWAWSTLTANVTGCLLIGVLMVLITERLRTHPLVRPLLLCSVAAGLAAAVLGHVLA
jgi:CrcB protein